MAKSSIADVYVSILPSISGITNNLKREFEDIATFAGNALAQGLLDGMNSAGNQISTAFYAIANDAATDFENALGNLSVPTSGIMSDFDTMAANAGQAVQDAVEAGVSAGMSAPLPPLTPGQTNPAIIPPVQQSTHTGVVAGFGSAGPKILAGLAALGIGKVISDSIGSALEKEGGDAKMAAALGLDPATAKKAADVASSLYQGAYGESMEAVQGSTRAILSSFSDLRNKSSEDIEAVSKRALNMASVFEIDVARAAQVASQMVTTGWAGDAVGAMDLLSASMSKVPANLTEDIMDAVDEYGPFMRTLGLEGEKGMQLLVKGASKGMYGIDKVGDSLKEFTIRATDMSTASGVGYEALGLSQEKMSAKLLAGGESSAEAFQTIVKGLQSIEDPVKQQTAALALFGTPLEDLSVNEIPQFLESLTATAGGLGDVTAQANEMDNTLNGTISQSVTKFKRTVETSFANAIFPLIRELQPLMVEAGIWFKNNQDRITEWARVFFDAIQGTLIPAIQTVLPYIQNLFKWMAENEEGLKRWVPRITDAALALGVLWGVVKGYTILSAAVTGIGAIITAVRLSTVAFWSATTASAAFSASVGWMAIAAVGVFALGLAIGTALTLLFSNFGMVWEGLKGFFTGIADNIKALTGGTYTAMGAIGGFILGIGALIANGIIGLINLVPYAINAMLIGVNRIGELVNLDWDIAMLPTIPYINFSVPAMATGGDVMGPTVALVGEKDPETIVDRGKMNSLIDNINAELMAQPHNGGGGDTYINVEVNAGPVESPDELARKVATAIEYNRTREA